MNIVYEVPCTCGKVYNSETKGRLETRLKEHRDDCSRGQTDNSAVAKHAWTEDFVIDWNGTESLQHASHTMELVMKEVQCIQTKPADSRFNQESRYELTDCWIAVSKKRVLVKRNCQKPGREVEGIDIIDYVNRIGTAHVSNPVYVVYNIYGEG